MKSCVLIVDPLRHVLVRSNGVFDPEDLFSLIRALIKLDPYRNSAWVLHDLREVTFDPAMLRTMPTDPTPNPGATAPARLAIVTSSSVGAALLDRFIAQRDRKGSDRRVFPTLEEALGWLDLPLNKTAIHPRLEALLQAQLAQAPEPSGIVFARISLDGEE